jgi:hypothetical protein
MVYHMIGVSTAGPAELGWRAPKWRVLLMQIASGRADSMSFRLVFPRGAATFKALSISRSEATEMGRIHGGALCNLVLPNSNR